MMNNSFISASCHQRCGTPSFKSTTNDVIIMRDRGLTLTIFTPVVEIISSYEENWTITSQIKYAVVQRLLLYRSCFSEADDTLEYLKSHNGIVDQPINDDENIVEDAFHMQLDGGTNNPSAVVTAPDMRGGIPTATAIDTPTVNATATRHLRQIVNILDSNDSATKRTHNYTVPLGHKVHPSKVPRTNTQGNLSTFNGMSALSTGKTQH
jgi:hypothetical protein